MKKFGRTLIISILIGALAAPTVLAAPTLSEQKKEAESELAALNNRMESLMKKINQTELELIETGQAIIQAEEDLAEAEEREQEQYEAMKSRIVTMYENGNASMLSKVFASGSLVEMIKQIDNVQSVHEYDRKQLDEFIKTKEEIAALKESLERDMAAIEAKQKTYEQDKNDLNVTIGQLKSKVSDIDRQIARAANNSAGKSQPSDSNYVPPVGTGGGAAIVSEAYKYLGVPYVWGGTSIRGVDCSGLVLLAHRAIGVSLPHYSGSIGVGGRAVARGDQQPGDVVCYSGHVGIYVGDGMMIHAPQTGDVVRVVKVYGSPWYRRYW